jgi:hypothetical protein
MARHSVAAACVLVLALSACSSHQSGGSGALVSASTAPQPVITAPSAITPSTSGPTHTSTHQPATHTPKPPGSSAPPQPADFGFSWSNAECQWSVTSDGKADVRMTGNVAATAPNTGMIVLTVTSNGGGVPSVTQYYPPAHLKTGDNRYVADINAPAADFESHTITFKGTLTFNGQPDDLAGDDAESLAVTFPATFQAATGESIENLGCSHVSN